MANETTENELNETGEPGTEYFMETLPGQDRYVAPLDETPLQDVDSVDESAPATSMWADAWRTLRKNPLFIISGLLILFIVFVALFPRVLTKQNPNYCTLDNSLEPASSGHPFGFDLQGCDVYSRVVYGTRTSLSVGVFATVLVVLLGTLIGALSGFFGGWVDMVMMRIVDIIYTVPDVLIVILLAAVLNYPLKELAMKPGFEWIGLIGVNLISIFVVFALLYWVGMARIVRSQIMILKEQEYVTAARALGASSGSIIKKHLLTNCIGTLIVTTTLQIPASIFTESYLSFIGLGVAAPLPSLGSLATDAVKGMNTYPHLLIAPAVMISVMILVFNLFGDGLRDAFDPKLKN